MTKAFARMNELSGSGARPTVSVIIATYNRAGLLREALRSVLSQTYRDFEVVVVDDGSTDGTRHAVEQLAATCPEIRYIHQESRGRSAARNRGIDLARGKYVAFLDSDDIWLPPKLEKQVAALEARPEYAMAYSSASVIDDAGNPLPDVYIASVSGSIYRDIAFYIPVTVLLPTVVIRADVLRRVGPFDVELDRFEDTDMWRRVSLRNRILAIREPLCRVRTHSANRLVAQDPDQIVKQVVQYVRKVVAEDGAEHRIFVRRGARRLCGHYGRAILRSPEWVAHGRKLIAVSLRYWPMQPFLWCLWALASPGLSQSERNGSTRRLLLKWLLLQPTLGQRGRRATTWAKAAFRDHSPPRLYGGLRWVYRAILSLRREGRPQ